MTMQDAPLTPWTIHGDGLFFEDANGRYWEIVPAGGAWQPAEASNIQFRAATRFAVAAANFVSPDPEKAQATETALALAVLRGDLSAAFGLADELIERQRRPGAFVGREELIEMLWRVGRDALVWLSSSTTEYDLGALLARLDGEV